jgi:hypothetical protein
MVHGDGIMAVDRNAVEKLIAHLSMRGDRPKHSHASVARLEGELDVKARQAWSVLNRKGRSHTKSKGPDALADGEADADLLWRSPAPTNEPSEALWGVSL